MLLATQTFKSTELRSGGSALIASETRASRHSEPLSTWVEPSDIVHGSCSSPHAFVSFLFQMLKTGAVESPLPIS